MGHYASEMISESDEGKKLKDKFFKLRLQLSNMAASRLSVGELREVFKLLSDKNIPRDFEGKVAQSLVREDIVRMKKILAKVK